MARIARENFAVHSAYLKATWHQDDASLEITVADQVLAEFHGVEDMSDARWCTRQVFVGNFADNLEIAVES